MCTLLHHELRDYSLGQIAFGVFRALPYVGKIWRGKILANLANGVQFAKFFHANSYKYSEIAEDLPADSPKFSSPFASSVMIRQNFLPPNFSYVRYLLSHSCFAMYVSELLTSACNVLQHFVYLLKDYYECLSMYKKQTNYIE